MVLFLGADMPALALAAYIISPEAVKPHISKIHEVVSTPGFAEGLKAQAALASDSVRGIMQ